MNNLNLTDDTKIRISIIAKYFPKGRDNALHQKEIADIHDIEPQDVKELAKKGREYGLPVLSDSCGYWISNDDEEIRSFVKSHEKYGRTCFKTVKALKQSLKVVKGQKTIEDDEEDKK